MTDDHRPEYSSPLRPYTQWGRATLGLGALSSLLVIAFVPLWSGFVPVAFLAGAFLVFSLTSTIIYYVVDRHAAVTAPPFTSATWVTVARGAAVAGLGGFAGLAAAATGGFEFPASATVTGADASASLRWAPAVLFAVAALLDAVDGWLARRTDSVTDLGARLDLEMDGLVVLVGTTVGVLTGVLPLVFLAVAVARYVFVASLWWRDRRGLPTAELSPSLRRRVLGALAMVAIFVALVPLVDPALSRPFALLVAVPFLANFARDWLVASGRLEST
ncbi:CDP-alcohol 1-archaetidyltransferase [Natrialba magadii ATCC 43099]|uniref:CDP-alcohol 1-archaetidyltransferase n=1 Tax=Natrialba magadii (strain ATCC 43099 / DSM 3394 / CCM 3739 / CIP 104546 / IAM 13178 / JCM 8861 / NBRC 102185 / NCIMB 2190 / MS3) TaxID=547559 RepID=D3STX6_NATMM|nr:CDP-alcohol phosphatidyltransferase family protein [Natrialba magadii]ADD07065.1 CDP-alcohol 1-archaetidyltransferase [Natrialba magadii ATCC 43099]ELY28792.1 CDP-alcohol phosphatidyltransferase [Natrialba magadii ATCC 43099]